MRATSRTAGYGIGAATGAFAFALACLAYLGASAPGHAQSRRAMTLVDLLDVPRILDPQIAPDGASIVYTLMRADWRANRQIGHIWRQNTAGGAPVQITHGEAGESSARWSPDGRSLLFLASRGNGLQIHLLPVDGGEARPLTRHQTSVSQPVWSPDGSSVYFLASDPPTADDRERERLKDDVFAFEENIRQRHLWRVRVADQTTHRITDGSYSVLSYRVSRDGRHLVVQRAPTPLVDDSVRSEIWVMHADGTDAKPLTSNGVEESEAELSPDNTQVLFVAEANDRLEPYYSSTLFLVPASGGTPRLLLPDFPHAIERAAWGPDSSAIFAVVNLGVRSEIFRIDVAGRTARPLTDGPHSVQFWSLSAPSGWMVFQIDEETRIGDAWILPLSGSGATAPRRITGIYDNLARDFYVPRQEKVTWTGADGAKVEGLLFYPAGHRPGTPSPLVVQLHGGPHESDKFGYGPGVIASYFPVLTAKGYAVLRPNYRGSSGYGSAFLRDVIGGYFRNMHSDVLRGVDAMVERGIANPERLALMGWSAGGHLTNKLITVTDRFKAASSTAGAANWASLYAQTDSRTHRAIWFGGPPWHPDAMMSYLNNSPVKDAGRVRTPTLFITGQEDARVPMLQAVEMYRALKAAKVTTRLLVAPREGHQWTELRHQLFKANAELEWFERHVMGRAYTWERAPDLAIK